MSVDLQVDGSNITSSGKYVKAQGGADSALSISTSKIGVGTESPDTKLEVDGIVRISDNSLNYLQIGAYTTGDNFGYLSSAEQSNGTGIKFETTNGSGGGAATRMTILNDGKVGIGTEDPDVELHIWSSGEDAQILIEADIAGDRAELQLKNNNVTWNVLNDGDSDNHFSITETGEADHLVIKKTSGNVGIGTENPSEKLEVNGTIMAQNFKGLPSNPVIIESPSGQDLTIKSGKDVIIDSGGDVTISIPNSSFTIDNQPNTGLFMQIQGGTGIDAGNVLIGPGDPATPQTARFAVMGGNVGIGTTEPSRELEVNGDILAKRVRIRDDLSALFSPDNAHLEVGSQNVGSSVGIQSGQVSDALVVAADGNVGIGTTTPVANLEITGNLNIGDGLVPSPSTSVNILNLAVGQEAFGNLNGISFVENLGGEAMKLGYDGTGSGDANALRFYGQSGDSILTIQNGGNVGIGITDPTAKMEIDGGGVVTGIGAITTVGIGTTITGTSGAFENVQIGAAITADSETRHVIAKASSTSLTVDTAVDWSTGFIWHFKNPLIELSDNGTSRLLARADGHVGIGTINPDKELSVFGDIMIRVNDKFIFGTSDDVYIDSPNETDLILHTGKDDPGGVVGIMVKNTNVAEFHINGLDMLGISGIELQNNSTLSMGATRIKYISDDNNLDISGNVIFSGANANIQVSGGIHIGGTFGAGENNLIVEGTSTHNGNIIANRDIVLAGNFDLVDTPGAGQGGISLSGFRVEGGVGDTRINARLIVGPDDSGSTARFIIEGENGNSSGPAKDAMDVFGGTGGTDVSGENGGIGGPISLTSGTGGNGTTSNGDGGDININTGPPGSGAGTPGKYGNVLLATNDGYVGIGTALPTAELSVDGDAIISRSVTVNSSSGENFFRVLGDNDPNLLFTHGADDYVGIGTNQPTAKLSIGEKVLISDSSLPGAPPTGGIVIYVDTNSDLIAMNHLEEKIVMANFLPT